MSKGANMLDVVSDTTIRFGMCGLRSIAVFAGFLSRCVLSAGAAAGTRHSTGAIYSLKAALITFGASNDVTLIGSKKPIYIYVFHWKEKRGKLQ